MPWSHTGANPFALLHRIDEAAGSNPRSGSSIWTATQHEDTYHLKEEISGSTNIPHDLVGVVWPQNISAVALTVTHDGRHTAGEPAVRSIYLVLRGGREALFVREPDTGATTAGVPPKEFSIGGENTWALRRTLELPSRAERPDIGPTRKRAIAAAAIDMLVEPPTEGWSVHDTVEHLLTDDGYYSVVAVAEMRYGLSAHSWSGAHEQARRQAHAVDRVSGLTSSLSTYLSWCDADMWAAHVHYSTPTINDAAAQLRHLVDHGTLTQDEAARLAQRYLSLDAPASPKRDD